MRWWLMAVLLTIELGEPFGQGAAIGRQLSAQLIEVNLTVEVPGGGSVVAHLVDPGEDQRTVAMANRGGEVFGTIFETKPADLVVVFEVVGDDGSHQSPPVTLTQLGLDPALLGLLPAGLQGAGDDEGLGANARQWGWLGLALGAAALSLIAFWALGGDGRRKERKEEGPQENGAPSEG